MNAKLKRVCIHWTAGGLKANAIDRKHYHFIFEDDGKVIKGVYPPEANARQLKNGDTYAAHCAGGNSWTLGVAVCGAFKGYKGGTFTQKSLEACLKFVAQFCKENGIPINEDTVYTHYEFGLKHKGTDSAGKIDISSIPWEPQLKPHEVGNWIRTKVKWYMVNP
jgi:hypothetical protein